jgi:hypothetical protein
MQYFFMFIAGRSAMAHTHAGFRLYKIIAAEKPDWIDVRVPLQGTSAGAPSILGWGFQFEVLKHEGVYKYASA